MAISVWSMETCLCLAIVAISVWSNETGMCLAFVAASIVYRDLSMSGYHGRIWYIKSSLSLAIAAVSVVSRDLSIMPISACSNKTCLRLAYCGCTCGPSKPSIYTCICGLSRPVYVWPPWLYLRGLTRPVFVWPIVAVSMVNRDLSTPVSVVYQDFSMSGLSWLYLWSMETCLRLAIVAVSVV